MAVGNPLGLAGTVTTGIVSALNRPVTTEAESGGPADPYGQGQAQSEPVVTNAIQTSAAINPGNSGGALVDASGQLIGINSSIASLGSSSGGQSGNIGIGFAIPVNEATSIAKQLIDNGTAAHAYLGVTPQDGTPSDGSATRAGAEVTSVGDGTPASQAGLRGRRRHHRRQRRAGRLGPLPRRPRPREERRRRGHPHRPARRQDRRGQGHPGGQADQPPTADPPRARRRLSTQMSTACSGACRHARGHGGGMSHRDSVRQLESDFADAMNRMYAVGNGLARLRAELDREAAGAPCRAGPRAPPRLRPLRARPSPATTAADPSRRQSRHGSGTPAAPARPWPRTPTRDPPAPPSGAAAPRTSRRPSPGTGARVP